MNPADRSRGQALFIAPTARALPIANKREAMIQHLTCPGSVAPSLHMLTKRGMISYQEPGNLLAEIFLVSFPLNLLHNCV
jgi:hypothetical protein